MQFDAPSQAELMRRSCGSSSSVPALPRGALESTFPVNASWPWLEVSTNPPSPPFAPPRARIVPAKVLSLSDHSTTLPPLPRPVADALMVVAASTLTVVAVGITKLSSLALGLATSPVFDGAREHITVAAVFGGDALGKIVDRLQRHLLAEDIGVELGQLRGGVNGRKFCVRRG